MLKFILVNDSDYIALGGSNIILDTKRSCFAFGFSVWSDRTILADTTILKRMMEGTIMCNFDDENGLPHDRVVSVEKQPSDTAAAPSTSALVPSTSAQTVLKRVRKPERKSETPASNLLLNLTPSTSVTKSNEGSSKKKKHQINKIMYGDLRPEHPKAKELFN